MDPLQQIPVTQIDPHALPRDRIALDPDALHQLSHSIATLGLRSPVEVWALTAPRPDPDSGPYRYGLISGLRRLAAVRDLGLQTIPAFIRTPATPAQALATMMTGNEVREPVSPWEKAALILNAVERGHFDTPDIAIAELFSAHPRTTQNRIRSHLRVVQDLGPLLASPASLSVRQLDMIATALANGHLTLLTATLKPLGRSSAETQWTALYPVLLDVLRTRPDSKTRRHLHLPQGLTIMREPSPTGWVLRFTGPQARSDGLIDDIFDMVEHWYGKP